MSELEQLADIITVILGKDNQARKQSEALLTQLQAKDLNQYILLFGNLLNVTPRKDLRSFCLLHLRRLLSKYANSQSESKWPYLTPETQKFLKDLFISVLLKEKESAPRNILCDLIGELIATIKTMDKEILAKCSEEAQWDSITQDIWAFMTSGSTILMECTLRILGVLFEVCPKDFTQNKEQLKSILKQSLDHEDLRVKTSAMQALQLYLVNVQTKDCKIFVDLMPILLTDLLIIIDKNEDLGADAMSYFSEIIEKEAKIFKDYIPKIIEALRAIAENNDLTIETIRENALEGIIVLAEKFPKLTGRQEGLLKNIFQSIFTYMITCVADIDNAWLRPPEGYVQTKDENDSQDFALKYCMDLFNRLMLCIDEDKALPTLSVLLKQMIDTNNWKYKYSALMALSQVSAAIVKIEDMDSILEFTLSYTKDENPKVRHAAFHCIGQFSDDKKYDFQQRYASKIIPTILEAFNEQVPRVLAHSLASLTNFLEGTSKSGIEGHIVSILEPCLGFIHSGISIVKENSVGVISALAEAARQDFTPYWEKTAEIIFEVLKNATQKEYKQLRGQCIECLTLLGDAVGKDLFRNVASEIINVMISIQKSHIEDYDPQKSYLLLGWQRLSSLFKQEFSPYLKEILPSLFEIIEKTIRNYERRQKAEETAGYEDENEGDEEGEEALGKTNTYESEEVAISVKMISTFLSESGDGCLPYIEKTIELFVFLLVNSRNDNLKIAVAKALPGIVKVIKTSTAADRGTIIANTCNTFLSMIWKAYFDDFDVSNMTTYLIAIKQILQEAGRFMDETQLNSFNETIITCLQDSDQRKRDNQQQLDEEADNIDEDMFNSLNEENEKEEELQCYVAGLIGTVFDTHQELALPLAQLISKQMLPLALDPKAPTKTQKFGLILVNNMIEHLGNSFISSDIPFLTEILIKFVDDNHPEIRETAAYGISTLAEKNKEYFQTILGPCVKALFSAVGTKPRKEENQRSFWKARVQVTIAFGRIIKHYSEHINLKEVVGAWFRNLPLSYFVEECRIQHDMLLDIIDLDSTLIFGERGQGLANAIQIFAQVLGTRLINPTFPERVKKLIETLAANEQVKPILQKAINDLEELQQEKLRKLMS